MKERPILMSAPMVRAILAGTKTQTRRSVKPQPPAVVESVYRPFPDEPNNWQGYGDGLIHWYGRCPYGVPGDRLWVRETWAEEHPLAVQEGRYSQPGRAGIPGPPGVKYRVIYRADGEPLQVWRRADSQHPYFTAEGPADEIDAKYPTTCSNFSRHGKAFWTPSIHMPRWASRITLEITGVRVERLQEISEEDAKAEGVEPIIEYSHDSYERGEQRYYVLAYRKLWDQINGAGSWDANHWIWAISFRRVSP